MPDKNVLNKRRIIDAPFGFLSAGAVGDTARLVFTQVEAQTAAADQGVEEIYAIVRNGGALAVVAGVARMLHQLAATGLSTLTSHVLPVTSSAFDLTVDKLIFGLSANPGASSVWTAQYVEAEMATL